MATVYVSRSETAAGRHAKRGIDLESAILQSLPKFLATQASYVNEALVPGQEYAVLHIVYVRDIGLIQSKTVPWAADSLDAVAVVTNTTGKRPHEHHPLEDDTPAVTVELLPVGVEVKLSSADDAQRSLNQRRNW